MGTGKGEARPSGDGNTVPPASLAAGGATGGSVAASPDGAYVYAAARFDHAVVQFKRDLASGTLTPWGYVREGSFGASGLEDPVDVTVSPNGAWMFVANYDGALVVLGLALTGCPGDGAPCCGDCDGDDRVTVEEIVAAANNSSAGCAGP